MTKKAKKVWDIIVRHGLYVEAEHFIDDLEAFASRINVDNEQEVLAALYKIIEAQA